MTSRSLNDEGRARVSVQGYARPYVARAEREEPDAIAGRGQDTVQAHVDGIVLAGAGRAVGQAADPDVVGARLSELDEVIQARADGGVDVHVQVHVGRGLHRPVARVASHGRGKLPGVIACTDAAIEVFGFHHHRAFVFERTFDNERIGVGHGGAALVRVNQLDRVGRSGRQVPRRIVRDLREPRAEIVRNNGGHGQTVEDELNGGVRHREQLAVSERNRNGGIPGHVHGARCRAWQIPHVSLFQQTSGVGRDRVAKSKRIANQQFLSGVVDGVPLEVAAFQSSEPQQSKRVKSTFRDHQRKDRVTVAFSVVEGRHHGREHVTRVLTHRELESGVAVSGLGRRIVVDRAANTKRVRPRGQIQVRQNLQRIVRVASDSRKRLIARKMARAAPGRIEVDRGQGEGAVRTRLRQVGDVGQRRVVDRIQQGVGKLALRAIDRRAPVQAHLMRAHFERQVAANHQIGTRPVRRRQRDIGIHDERIADGRREHRQPTRAIG